MIFLHALFLMFPLAGSVFSSSGSEESPSIIIVGSGAAAIAAATRLLKNNFTDIKIFEAENRIGGRIHSVPFEDEYVDLGAEACTRESVVYSLVKDLGVLQPFIGEEHLYFSNGQRLDESLSKKILKLAHSVVFHTEPLDACKNAVTHVECLRILLDNLMQSTVDPEEKQVLKDSFGFLRTLVSEWYSPLDPNDVAYKAQVEYSPGDDYMNWKSHGYKTVLDVMMQKYPKPDDSLPIDDKIFLNVEVKRITNWNSGNKVTVRTSNGSVFQADHVIFTPSLGVLKAHHGQLFEPALPLEKQHAIDKMGYGVISKLLMHFSHVWWHKNVDRYLIWSQEDRDDLYQKKLNWLLDLSTINQHHHNDSKILIAWFGGENVPFIEKLSDEELLEGVKYAMHKFFGKLYNVTVPDKSMRFKWYSNPHFRGAYSYQSVKARDGVLQETLAKPLVNGENRPTLFFAGEATHSTRSSTVAGAIESGYREAERLIQLYKM